MQTDFPYLSSSKQIQKKNRMSNDLATIKNIRTKKITSCRNETIMILEIVHKIRRTFVIYAI